MLTEIKAYSSWRSAPTLSLSDAGRPDTDLIQIRNVDGLDPVKASVTTSPFGSVDGASYSGSSVLSRNIVLTLRPNPDWETWSYESLRRLIYSYFMPKRLTKLAFFSDDMVPVEISGIVESVSVNIFSKDPELVVSIICPDPYFISVDPVIITGVTTPSNPIIVDYEGNIETGMYIRLTSGSGGAPTYISIQAGDQTVTEFYVDATVNSNKYFEMSSLPLQKFVQNVGIGDGVITNLLSKVQEGAQWPTFQPGENEFSVVTDGGTHDWELRYFERFGGL